MPLPFAAVPSVTVSLSLFLSIFDCLRPYELCVCVYVPVSLLYVQQEWNQQQGRGSSASPVELAAALEPAAAAGQRQHHLGGASGACESRLHYVRAQLVQMRSYRTLAAVHLPVQLGHKQTQSEDVRISLIGSNTRVDASSEPVPDSRCGTSSAAVRHTSSGQCSTCSG